MKKILVVYHANCCDGFTAAYVFNNSATAANANVIQYMPMSYGDSIEPLLAEHWKDWRLYILDFSFKREPLKQICSNFAYTVLLDHHKTAQEDLENWEDAPKNLEIVFDMARSGARITADYVHVGDFDNVLVDYVQDRDLWKHEMECTKEINAVIQATPKSFEAYGKLVYKIYNKTNQVIYAGKILLAYQEALIQSFVNQAHEMNFELSTGSYHGLCTNCPGEFSSEVGNRLAIASGSFGATWAQLRDRSTKFSVRSVGDYDVTRIAKEFGGGGHKNASGFSLGVVSSPFENEQGHDRTIPPGTTIWSHTAIRSDI